MKIYQRIGLIAAVLCGIAALEARAQLAGTEVGPGSFILNFDENSNGQITEPGGLLTQAGLLQIPTRVSFNYCIL